MSLFLLADGTHASFNKHRTRFFWEGVRDKPKQHWVNWAKGCQPKDHGGLGITNTKFMNIALMVKWIWLLFTDNPKNTLWCRIIRAKYPGAGDIFFVTSHGGSPFWCNMHKITDFLKLGARFSPGNG
jgi:hypothetical protein